jgi:hypothetical protein
MISVKKLMPETDEDQAEFEHEQTIERKDNRLQNIVKLLIMMLLTYVIIFM